MRRALTCFCSLLKWMTFQVSSSTSSCNYNYILVKLIICISSNPNTLQIRFNSLSIQPAYTIPNSFFFDENIATKNTTAVYSVAQHFESPLSVHNHVFHYHQK